MVACSIGTGTNKIGYSYDGSTWQPSTSGNNIFTGGCNAIAWNGTRWLASGGGSTGAVMATSIDGINWNPTTSAVNCKGIASNGSRWVAVGAGTNRISYSDDNGQTWTPATTANPIFIYGCNNIAWNGVQWLATGAGTAPIAYSANAIDWFGSISARTAFNSGSGSSNIPTANSVAWNGSLWIACAQGEGVPGIGSGRSIAYSSNGIDWNISEIIGSVLTYNANSVAWNKMMWVATGDSGIAYSYDGIKWYACSGSLPRYGNSVAWNGSLWIVGGQQNPMYTSRDGITWELLQSGGGIILAVASRNVLPCVGTIPGWTPPPPPTTTIPPTTRPPTTTIPPTTTGPPCMVTTLAGSGLTWPVVNGVGTAASFRNPSGLAVDTEGNVIVADLNNHLIRKVTPEGVVSTLAGDTIQGATLVDGHGTAASFLNPCAIAVDTSGNFIIADHNNHCIRRLTRAGQVSTIAGGYSNGVLTGRAGAAGFADGSGSAVRFRNPNGVAVDANNNIYVADYSNHRIRKITPSGVVSTLAGSGNDAFADGTGTAASFSLPFSVAVDASGNVIVGDQTNHRIRKITPEGVVSTLAGSTLGFADGTGTAALFYQPTGVAVDAGGNVIVADKENNRIRRVTPSGVVTTIAGNAGVGANNGGCAAATFHGPSGVAIDMNGKIFVTDSNGNRIRAITNSGVLAGARPGGQILALQTTTGLQTTTPPPTTTGPRTTTGVQTTGLQTTTGVQTTALQTTTPNPTIISRIRGIFHVRTATSSVNNPYGVAIDASNNVIIADTFNHCIKRMTPGGSVSIVAGISGTPGAVDNTNPTIATFNSPYHVAVDMCGNIFVTDNGNNKIRKITPQGVVTTLAGTGTTGADNGPGSSATFSGLNGITIDSNNNIYVADQSNHRIRMISNTTGVVSTFAGNGTPSSVDGPVANATLSSPCGVAADSNNNIYVTAGGLIRRIASGNVSTFAGSSPGWADGVGSTAKFSSPIGIVADSNNNIYVGDMLNQSIRMITPAGIVTTIAGSSSQSIGSADGVGVGNNSFNYPCHLTINSNGVLYVADSGNSRIREITEIFPTTTPLSAINYVYTTSTYLTGFNRPRGCIFNLTGNFLYVANTNSNQIIRYTITGGTASAPSIMNNTPTNFSLPLAFTIDPSGNIYCLNYDPPCSIIKIDQSNNITTLTSILNYPTGITHYSGFLYISYTNLNSIHRYNIGTNTITNNFITGITTPGSLVADTNGNLYAIDCTKKVIMKYVITTTPPTPSVLVGGGANGMTAGNQDGVGTNALFNFRNDVDGQGIALDTNGNLFVSDGGQSLPQTIRRINIASQVVTTIAGGSLAGSADGVGTLATFNYPAQLTLLSNDIYVADAYNNIIRKLTATIPTITGAPTTTPLPTITSPPTTTGLQTTTRPPTTTPLPTMTPPPTTAPPIYMVTTLAGSVLAGNVDGAGTGASFQSPSGIAIDPDGTIYVTDTGNNRIRKVTSGGVVTTLAGSGTRAFADGTGTGASFNLPRGIAIGPDGTIYVADTGNHRIRKVTSGVVTTLAGGLVGSLNGTGTGASFNTPRGIAIGPDGNIYVADWANSSIRKVTPGGVFIKYLVMMSGIQPSIRSK
jgi:sugar lactone lactonase YvrE